MSMSKSSATILKASSSLSKSVAVVFRDSFRLSDINQNYIQVHEASKLPASTDDSRDYHVDGLIGINGEYETHSKAQTPPIRQFEHDLAIVRLRPS